MDAAFALRNATLGYGQRKVMEIAELVVPTGGMACLIGPSGAGKSTLLEAIGLMSNTFLPPAAGGTVFQMGSKQYDPLHLWNGPVESLAELRRRHFSFIFQSTNLMPNFTVGENIRMAYQGDSEDLFTERVAALLDRMDLPRDVLDRSTHELSGGQRQRIAFIRALAKDYSVLLADEPTGNLDRRNAVALFGLLREEASQQGRTAVVVTHHVGLANEFGDTIIEIRPGAKGAPSVIVPRKTTTWA